MVMPRKEVRQPVNSFEFAQLPNNIEQESSSTISLSLLKSFEERLCRRGSLPESLGLFNPVWFLAETERNIFLWRKGFSLVHADRYSFRVDTNKLVSKRLDQIRLPDDKNPFLNPLWSQGFCGEECSRREQDYLLTYLELLRVTSVHLSALSDVQDSLLESISPSEPRPMVVLPAFFTQH